MTLGTLRFELHANTSPQLISSSYLTYKKTCVLKQHSKLFPPIPDGSSHLVGNYYETVGLSLDKINHNVDILSTPDCNWYLSPNLDLVHMFIKFLLISEFIKPYYSPQEEEL